MSRKSGLFLWRKLNRSGFSFHEPRQLLIETTVAGILPADRLDGRVILADIALLDLVEAFYDEYALPEHGIIAGKPLTDRIAAFEGLRVYAKSLEDVGPLQAQIEASFDIRTDAKSREIAATIGLGRNLNLALSLTAVIAAAGLAATLFFGFWGEVLRRKRTLATLSLLGIPPDRMALFPLVQALTAASLALILAFALVPFGAWAAESLFAEGLAEGERLFRLHISEGVLIALAVLVLVALTALYAAYEAGRTDPAIVLRDAE